MMMMMVIMMMMVMVMSDGGDCKSLIFCNIVIIFIIHG